MSNYKRFFLDGFKYVFITIVTYNRQRILIDNIDLLRKSFNYAKTKLNFSIFAAVILQDHLHLILKLENEKDFPKIIFLIKNYFSRHITTNLQLPTSQLKRREKGIWQRRYWDHIIRNEKDLNIHLDYIHYNPYKHYNIAPKDWKYSSFNKFIKEGYYEPDWFNFEDKNGINNKDFE